MTITVSAIEDDASTTSDTKPKRVRKKPEQQTTVDTPPPPPPTTPPPPPPSLERQSKTARMATCKNCGKEMLEKTFKYYHQLKCQQAEQKPQTTKPTTPPEDITVDFAFQRRVKQDKYASLLTKAF